MHYRSNNIVWMDKCVDVSVGMSNKSQYCKPCMRKSVGVVGKYGNKLKPQERVEMCNSSRYGYLSCKEIIYKFYWAEGSPEELIPNTVIL